MYYVQIFVCQQVPTFYLERQHPEQLPLMYQPYPLYIVLYCILSFVVILFYFVFILLGIIREQPFNARAAFISERSTM